MWPRCNGILRTKMNMNFSFVGVKCMEKNIGITKPLYSEHISPAPCRSLRSIKVLVYLELERGVGSGAFKGTLGRCVPARLSNSDPIPYKNRTLQTIPCSAANTRLSQVRECPHPLGISKPLIGSVRASLYEAIQAGPLYRAPLGRDGLLALKTAIVFI